MLAELLLNFKPNFLRLKNGKKITGNKSSKFSKTIPTLKNKNNKLYETNLEKANLIAHHLQTTSTSSNNS